MQGFPRWISFLNAALKFAPGSAGMEAALLLKEEMPAHSWWYIFNLVSRERPACAFSEVVWQVIIILVLLLSLKELFLNSFREINGVYISCWWTGPANETLASINSWANWSIKIIKADLFFLTRLFNNLSKPCFVGTGFVYPCRNITWSFTVLPWSQIEHK